MRRYTYTDLRSMIDECIEKGNFSLIQLSAFSDLVTEDEIILTALEADLSLHWWNDARIQSVLKNAGIVP